MMMVAAFCSAIVASPASAQSVREAMAHYEALEFEKVIPKVKQALADPNLTVEDRILALAFLGRTRAIFRRTQAAHKSFVRLLELAPEYSLEEYESPLIHEAFAIAKTRWQKRSQRQERTAISTEESARTPGELEELAALRPPPRDPMAEPSPPPPETKTIGSKTTLWVVLGASAAVLAAGSIALAVIRPWERSEASLGTLALP